MKSMKKKMEVQDHWRTELTKVRCWITGFQAGRRTPGVIDLDNHIPGEEVLRQIIMAIDEAK
jgi:hypothetical protein